MYDGIIVDGTYVVVRYVQQSQSKGFAWRARLHDTKNNRQNADPSNGSAGFKYGSNIFFAGARTITTVRQQYSSYATLLKDRPRCSCENPYFPVFSSDEDRLNSGKERATTCATRRGSSKESKTYKFLCRHKQREKLLI
jgi:hypothetical protein